MLIEACSTLVLARRAAIAMAMLVIVRTYTDMNQTAVQRLTVLAPTQDEKHTTKQSFFPRIVHITAHPRSITLPYDVTKRLNKPSKSLRIYDLPAIVREVQGNEMSISRSKCPHKQDWHDRTYPTCNSVHEIDFFAKLQQIGSTDPSKPLQYLGTGGTRDTWKTFDQQTNNTIKQPLAFKTLRLDREYIWPRIDHQRVDAIVSERLTFSPHVVDIYGYCGTATINEFGEGDTLDHYILGKNHTTPMQKLEYARDIAYALADLHELDGYPSSTVQHDLKPKNILVVANGKVKLGDFNNAHFLGKNTDQRCLFNFIHACEIMKITPHAQECQLGGLSTAKIEVFQLGFILHFLLMPELFGLSMHNPPLFEESSEHDMALSAVRSAVEAAFTVNVMDRPNARDIGNFLANAMATI